MERPRERVVKIGFTGTRRGATPRQREALANLVRELTQEERGVAHHGDCVGADEQFDTVAREYGCRVVLHPPGVRRYRAFLAQPGDVVCRPDGYSVRNQAIVDACDLLVACPSGPEAVRSGTWSTVRKARAARKPVWVVWPDGTTARDAEAARYALEIPDERSERERYRIYLRVRGDLKLVATTPTEAGIGVALTTLSAEGELGDGSGVGVLDGTRRRWIVLPWSPR